MKYIEGLRNGLEECINKYDVLLFGEDIGEPYGGAFKVTKGLSDKYPKMFL
jgi:pyruvate/2-oxoglutarate/acetoin dehydrogenase E1 component